MITAMPWKSHFDITVIESMACRCGRPQQITYGLSFAIELLSLPPPSLSIYLSIYLSSGCVCIFDLKHHFGSHPINVLCMWWCINILLRQFVRLLILWHITDWHCWLHTSANNIYISNIGRWTYQIERVSLSSKIITMRNIRIYVCLVGVLLMFKWRFCWFIGTIECDMFDYLEAVLKMVCTRNHFSLHHILIPFI